MNKKNVLAVKNLNKVYSKKNIWKKKENSNEQNNQTNSEKEIRHPFQG